MPRNAQKKTIGDVIKTARLRLNLSAEEAGQRCNVSRSRFYMWEAETYVFPKNLPGLARVLRLPLKKLEQVNTKKH